MPRSLIPIGKLKERLMKLLRKKYESPNRPGEQRRRNILKISNKIRLVKETCKRRNMNMVEINYIINSWDLISTSGPSEETEVAEPIGLEEAIADTLGEY
jgi:hypothetical protein